MKKAIYKITNMINNKCYIGQSVNPQHRFSAHKSRARNHDYHECQALYNAINKYGENNFVLEILEWTENYNIREQELIKQYNTLSPNGYNILKGGEEPPHKYGEDHFKSVINDGQVERVIQELKRGILTESQIGKLFNPPFKQSLIHNINWGITHYKKEEDYPIREQCPYHFSEENMEDITWLLTETQVTMKEIAKYFKCNDSAIKAINTGRNHYNKTLNYPLRKNRGHKQLQPVETILANRSTLVIDTQVEMGICE